MAGQVEVRTGVQFRDERGRFLAKIKEGSLAAFKEMAEDGAAIAHDLAPPPSAKRDPRSAHITDSFYHDAGEDYALWGNSARHAMAVEEGSIRHLQSGNVSFFWDKKGRWWKSGSNLIDHPATAAKSYLRPSYYAIVQEVRTYLKRHME